MALSRDQARSEPFYICSACFHSPYRLGILTNHSQWTQKVYQGCFLEVELDCQKRHCNSERGLWCHLQLYMLQYSGAQDWSMIISHSYLSSLWTSLRRAHPWRLVWPRARQWAVGRRNWCTLETWPPDSQRRILKLLCASVKGRQLDILISFTYWCWALNWLSLFRYSQLALGFRR